MLYAVGRFFVDNCGRVIVAAVTSDSFEHLRMRLGWVQFLTSLESGC